MANQLKEKLFDDQVQHENELFRYLSDRKKSTALEAEEQAYLDYYRRAFLGEIISAIFLLPSSIAGYSFHKENKRHFKRVQLLNIKFLIFMTLTVPTVNLWLYSSYKRYFSKPQNEEKLKQRYAIYLHKYRIK